MTPEQLQPPPDPRSAAAAILIEKIARLMDSAVRIPGTKVTVGLDAAIGLLPFGGDAITGVVQTGVFLAGVYHYRVPRAIAARMAANVLLDMTIGLIPIVGNVFDVFFKANTRNLQLLNQVAALRKAGQPVPTAPSIAYLIALGVGLVAVFGIVIALFVVALLAFINWAMGRPVW